MRVRLRLSLAILVVVAVLGGSLGALLVHAARVRSERALQERLLAIAITAAEQIDGDHHERIRTEADPEFAAIRDQLRRVQRANRLGTEVYTLVPDGPSSTRFGAMTNVSPFVGHAYPYRPAMAATFERGEASATEVYRDDHGAWISAYAPIRTSDGRVVALVEVDETAEALGRLQREETLTAAALVAGCLLAGVIVAMLLGGAIARRLETYGRALELRAEELARANADLASERGRLSLLAHVLTALNEGSSAEALGRGVLRAVLGHSAARAGVVFATHDDDATLEPIARAGLDEAVATQRMTEGLAGRAADERRVLVHEAAMPFDLGVARRALTAVALPIQHAERVVAVLVLGYDAASTAAQASAGALEPVLPQVGIALVNTAANQRTRALAAELRRSELSLREQAAALARANEELERAGRHKSEFIATMSHEFRTPLNTILGYADLATLGLADDESRGYLVQLRRAGQRLLALIEDLLSLARLEAGKVEVRADRLALPPLLEELTASTQALAAAEVEVRRECPPDLELTTDGGKLNQILTNLLGNAAKFTERGSILLRAARAEHEVRFEVTDTGPGIAPEHLRTIFEAFRQVDGSATRHHGGAGLGLAIVQRLVELLGGRIEVESVPGAGSTFSVSLPAARDGLPAGPAADPPSLPMRPPGGGLTTPPSRRLDGVREEPRALLLARPGAARDRVARFLTERGALVSACDLSLDEPGDLAPDVIVVDLGGEHAQGLSALAQLRRDPRYERVPVVVVASDAEGPRPVEVVAQEYVVKPIEPDDLCQAVFRCLDSPAGHVLVVDDDPATRELTGAILSRRGYDVTLADSGAAALERMRVERPDALVLDLMMPGLSGFDVLARMAEQPTLCAVPVVVLTAKDLDRDDHERLRRGVAAVVQKGADDVWALLIGAIEGATRRPQSVAS